MELMLSVNNNPNNILNTDMTLGKINFDVDLVKDRIRDYLSKYEGLVIKEEDIKEIKSEVAFLRKQKKLIDKNRIDFTKEFDKPLVTYKENCDSIMDLIEETIVYLNSQLNDFEEKRKEIKRKEVEFLMDKVKLIRHMPDDFEFIFEDSFLNTTKTLTKIQKELLEQCNQYELTKQLEKAMEENEKAKKLLLENLIIKLNENLDIDNQMKYTEYEHILDEIELEDIEKYILEEFKKYLDKQMNKEDIEKEVLDNIENKNKEEQQELETNNYSITLYDVTKAQIEQIQKLLINESIGFRIELLKRKDEFDSEIEIIG